MKYECFKCNSLKDSTTQLYIIDDGRYICQECQEKFNMKLADMELLKRIGSKDIRHIKKME